MLNLPFPRSVFFGVRPIVQGSQIWGLLFTHFCNHTFWKPLVRHIPFVFVQIFGHRGQVLLEAPTLKQRRTFNVQKTDLESAGMFGSNVWISLSSLFVCFSLQ